MSTEPISADFTRVVFPDVQPAARARREDSGFTQGHAAGYAAGLQAAAGEQQRVQERLEAEHRAMLDAGRLAVREAVLALESAAAAARHDQGAVLEDAEEVLAAGAIELAEAILGYELANGDPGRTAHAALERALGASGASGTPGSPGIDNVTTVRLNPEDLAALAAVDVGDITGVELKADPALGRGDAVAEYPHGWLDARLGTALNRAKQALLGNEA